MLLGSAIYLALFGLCRQQEVKKKSLCQKYEQINRENSFFLIGRDRDECKEEIYLNELFFKEILFVQFKREASEYRVTILGF